MSENEKPYPAKPNFYFFDKNGDLVSSYYYWHWNSIQLGFYVCYHCVAPDGGVANPVYDKASLHDLTIIPEHKIDVTYTFFDDRKMGSVNMDDPVFQKISTTLLLLGVPHEFGRE